ncbi:MAG: hypothetical protein R2843_01510 [Thermomicrobiales bacterium]
MNDLRPASGLAAFNAASNLLAFEIAQCGQNIVRIRHCRCRDRRLIPGRQCFANPFHPGRFDQLTIDIAEIHESFDRRPVGSTGQRRGHQPGDRARILVRIGGGAAQGGQARCDRSLQ